MLFYNSYCSVFTYSTVAGCKCEINVLVIVIVNNYQMRYCSTQTDCVCCCRRDQHVLHRPLYH